MELLIDNGANVNAVNAGITPLYWAAQNGYRDIVSLLLRNGARPDSVTARGDTPLSVAKENGHNDIVELLECHLAATPKNAQQHLTGKRDQL